MADFNVYLSLLESLWGSPLFKKHFENQKLIKQKLTGHWGRALALCISEGHEGSGQTSVTSDHTVTR